jgi:transposase-like protein
MFNDAETARRYFEESRWPRHVTCPLCGSVGKASQLWPRPGSRCPARPGTWKCFVCRRQFNVFTGTPLHGSHVDPHHWLLGVRSLCSDYGTTVADFQRATGLTRKTARLVLARIQAAVLRPAGEVSTLQPRRGRRRSRTRRFLRLSFSFAEAVSRLAAPDAVKLPAADLINWTTTASPGAQTASHPS